MNKKFIDIKELKRIIRINEKQKAKETSRQWPSDLQSIGLDSKKKPDDTEVPM